MIICAVKKISVGYVGVAFTEKGIKLVCLPQKTPHIARGNVIKGLSGGNVMFDPSRKLACKALEQIEGYFQGKVREFNLPLDLRDASRFSLKVWEATRKIPYGTTKSYGWVAKGAGNPRAARAVGGALGRNPLPLLIPCHRVVRSDGALGGFGAGLSRKKRLLALEAGYLKQRRLAK